ncbi:hypothetical protein PIB30_042758 [Stylosanthes scabra]|uniref:Protein CHUP1, chloroplastic n=1 Tax=Stylosanthes scabra TaxID=79078 RepID=A0ABU6UEL0_9FABA|nr:hypothetical protein [Stylosanthes scabra]
MIVRLGFLVAASIAAFKIQQLNVNKSKSEHGAARIREHQEGGTAHEKVTCSSNRLDGNNRKEKEEEQEEEVKLISNIINQHNDFEDDILPEFERFLSAEIEFDENDEVKKDWVHENEKENDASELERLRNLVRELEEREVKLEGELLEYYGLKEQESNVAELQRKLQNKMVEIDMLHVTIDSLMEERRKLQEELADQASSKNELEVARSKIKELRRQIQVEANQTKGQLLLLKQQVSGLQAREEEAVKNDAEIQKKLKAVNDLEVEVVELKRENKELQHEKRELTAKLNAAESRITEISNVTENEMVTKAKEEVSRLTHANGDLQKQVEGLQMNRFSEVEELVYLQRGRVDTDIDSIFSRSSSPGSEDLDNTSIDSSTSKYSSLSKKPSLIQKLKKWGKSKDDSSTLISLARSSSEGTPGRRSASDRPRGTLESLMLRNAVDDVAITAFGPKDQEPTVFLEDVSSSDSLNSVSASFPLMSKSVEGSLDERYPAYKDRHKLALAREKEIREKAEKARVTKFSDDSNVNMTKARGEGLISLPPKLAHIKENGRNVDNESISKMKLGQIEKRPPRIPRPPPKPSDGAPDVNSNTNPSNEVPHGLPVPPPPPPPPGGSGLPRGAMDGDKVHRAPELVEFYKTLMKREAKKDTSSLVSSTTNASDAKNNMIGEIENRSSFLLAVKADVETQGDFVMSLATEVRAASFSNIEDLVPFVNWLDEELSFLVDERAVLKHFDWPEGKADALREAAFEYQDLMKLEEQVSTFIDDPELPCEAALQKMYSLLEKVEQSVYALLRTRDMAISRYREFRIPVNWLLDSGVVDKPNSLQIKLSSVQLARKYMKRVTSELDTLSGPEKEPAREFLILQGVRFAFRVHQVTFQPLVSQVLGKPFKMQSEITMP